MSNLSNLHISGSYRGLINLEDSTKPLVSQSGDINLQDGLGDNVGLKINAQTKKFTIDNDLRVDGNTDLNGNLDVSGSFVHSGSIDIKGNVVVDGNINATIGTFDTINTRLLHVTEESASVIISSGSNVIGDETSDTQTIVGQTTISGSLSLLNGTNLTVINGDISSSTVSGIGNVTTYSSSVDSRINSLSNRTGSVDSSIVALNSFTSSQLSINSGYNTFTQSINTEQTQQNNRLDSLEAFTGSLVTDFVETADFNAYTSSTDSRLNSLEIKSGSVDSSINSINLFTQSADNQLNSLNSFTQSADNRLTQIESVTSSLESDINNLVSQTGSYATTGSNTFDGTQTISGSVYGNINSISIASNTASMDCSTSNFFSLSLPAGTTHLTATNIQPGQTISLKVTNATTSSVVVSDTNTIKYADGVVYVPSGTANSIDVLTFVSFDSTELLAVPTNNLS